LKPNTINIIECLKESSLDKKWFIRVISKLNIKLIIFMFNSLSKTIIENKKIKFKFQKLINIKIQFYQGLPSKKKKKKKKKKSY